MKRGVHTASIVGWMLVTFAFGARVHAQVDIPADTGFSVERFTPAPGNTSFLSMDHADALPHGAMSFTASASLMSRPIALRELDDDDLATVPVDNRLGLDLSFAYGLGARFQAGIALPVVVYQDGDRLRDIGLDETGLARSALGDIRLHGKARVLGRSGWRGPAAAVGVDMTLPTGNDEHFAGERGVIVGVRAMGSWRHQWFSAGMNAGVRLRTERAVLLSPARPHNHEWWATWGAAVALPTSARYAASLLAEYALVIADKSSGSARGPSPGEWRVGARLSLCTGLSFTVGGGAGTTPDDVGSPAWRLLGSVRYDTSSVTDIDRDGIEDGRDQCRQQAEDRDGFEDVDGCPDNDNDNDGYPDFADDCPDAAEDYDGHRDVDGCPDDQRTIGDPSGDTSGNPSGNASIGE